MNHITIWHVVIYGQIAYWCGWLSGRLFRNNSLKIAKLEADLTVVRAQLEEALGCPHRGNCACAVTSRHEAFEWFIHEKERAEEAEAALTALRAEEQACQRDILARITRENDLSDTLTALKDDGDWRMRWHMRLSRGVSETEGRFYERIEADLAAVSAQLEAKHQEREPSTDAEAVLGRCVADRDTGLHPPELSYYSVKSAIAGLCAGLSAALELKDKAEAVLTALRAERDEIQRIAGFNPSSGFDIVGLVRSDYLNFTDRLADALRAREKAEAELAEARAGLAVPAWQEEVRKALEFCATATASVTPGYIDIPMTLAFVQAKAKEALALMPMQTPSETTDQLCRWCFKSIKEHTGTFLQCPNGVTYQQFEAAP